MSLNAIIMAGGEGTRLRPLTCDTPKPMVPVLGKPVMTYALKLLKQHGLTEVGVTLQFLPEKISRHFGSGASSGVHLHYTRERTPLGTAGGVLLASKGRYAPRETFVVLSGDGLTDINLTEALAFHRAKGALATMVLTRVRDPLAYGVVIADEEGRVLRFVEKPGWGEVYSDTVNTGIYLLEPQVLGDIWPDKPCDFGRDLFPKLVREGKDVFAFVSDAYWCDIGDMGAYIRAQADFLNGKIRLDAGPFIAETAQIDDSAIITGPCSIGPGARVMAHAKLSDCAVIGMNAVVGPHARVARSVLWQDAEVRSGAQVMGGVVCAGAQVFSGASVLEESALGDGAVLGARASLEAGAKVWPGKRIDPCMHVTENVVWEGVKKPTLLGGMVDTPDSQTACLLAAAFAEATEAQTIAIGHSGSPEAIALYSAVESALVAQGVAVLLAGQVMLSTFRAAQRLCGAPAGLYALSRRIVLTDRAGCMPGRPLKRKVESFFVRQDYAKPFSRSALLPVALTDAEALHIGMLSLSIPGDTFSAAKPHIAVFVAQEWQIPIVERVMKAAQLSGRVSCGEPAVEAWETGFSLSETGESVAIFDEKGAPDITAQRLLLYAALPDSGDWIARMDETAALEALALQRGNRVRRVSAEEEAFAASLLSADMRQLDMHYDGLFCMLQICRLLAQRGTTLRGLLGAFPTLHRHMERIPVALPKRGRLLRAIAEGEKSAELSGGLRVTRDSGWLTVNPDERAAEMVVVGESASMEAARELCGEIMDRLRKG